MFVYSYFANSMKYLRTNLKSSSTQLQIKVFTFCLQLHLVLLIIETFEQVSYLAAGFFPLKTALNGGSLKYCPGVGNKVIYVSYCHKDERYYVV